MSGTSTTPAKAAPAKKAAAAKRKPVKPKNWVNPDPEGPDDPAWLANVDLPDTPPAQVFVHQVPAWVGMKHPDGTDKGWHRIEPPTEDDAEDDDDSAAGESGSDGNPPPAGGGDQ